MHRAISSPPRSQTTPLLAAALAFTSSLLLTATSSACPSCPVGSAARQQVLDRDFGMNMTIALLPFLIIGLVARWAERIGAERTVDEARRTGA